jgi:hypothetical protein
MKCFKKEHQRGGIGAQVVECLPSKCEALSSNSPQKIEEERTSE